MDIINNKGREQMVDYQNLSLEELLEHEQDSASWYWIGMSYFKRSDLTNAVLWLKKAMNDPDNVWMEKAALNVRYLTCR